MEVIRETIEHKEFLKQFTLQQLRGRYRGSALGFLWTFFIPVLTLAAFTLFFSIINRGNGGSRLPMVLSAYAPWLFFTTATGMAIYSIVANSVYITKVRSPKSILPLSMVVISLIELAAFVLALLLFVPLVGGSIGPAVLFLPVSIVLLSVFTLGFCLLVATMNVFLRDVALLWVPLSLVWFLLTPIFYRIEDVPAEFRVLLEANPILPFIRLFQDPIAHGVLPSAETIVMATLYAVIMFSFGSAIFTKSQKSFYSYV
ncbi:MAG TPA: ABC transporter permease [Bryobacteraceae bacterium]|nr:ABC transporter permease [Bryobacteraceae bacterium]